MSKVDKKSIREMQIKRRLLKAAAYADIIIGIINLFIANYYRYCVTPRNEELEAWYALIGFVVAIIGWGGVKYEEVIARRYSSYERSLYISR